MPKDIEALAILLDTKFQGPFGFRFGIDGLVGLIPGGGDVATSALSFYIVIRAALLGAPVSLVLRLILNILIESVVGVVPVIGNVFDFIWKSNSKNVDLVKRLHTEAHSVTLQSRFIVWGLITIALGATASMIWMAVLILQYLLSLF